MLSLANFSMKYAYIHSSIPSRRRARSAAFARSLDTTPLRLDRGLVQGQTLMSYQTNLTCASYLTTDHANFTKHFQI